MFSTKRLHNLIAWLVFAIAFIVYFLTAERTGSLWDCGEFILGAYKLQVVHPPGAPLFMIIGRLFAWIGSIFSDDPAMIAFGVNLMSGVCTAFTASFVARITMIFGKMALVGRGNEAKEGEVFALAGAGLVAGLATTFTSSIWFSAVEGEVYAMSTFFTALTFWAASVWYSKPDNKYSDRWLVFSLYAAGLSVGVHLLSLLCLPAIGLLYYFKKYEKHNILGIIASLLAGVGGIVFIQRIVIAGIPGLWKDLEVPLVNSLGLPFHSGLIVTVLLVSALIFFVLRLAHARGMYLLQLLTVSAMLTIIGFSTIGVIVIRANADTPINMNAPSDATRLLPYLNREQYGERPLLYGPHFDARPIPGKYDRESRYGRVGDRYEIVDEKLTPNYKASDKIFFPRIGHNDPGRPALHRMHWGKKNGEPGMGYNLKYFVKYQMGWMYWRYFMWNYAGRQNGDQGFYSWDESSGHWQSGIKFIDEARFNYDIDGQPEFRKRHKASNSYYFLPLIFGIFGFLFHARKRPKDFSVLLILFLITGLGIILYSNQPPNEPRERDYVLVGSFFTFCIWIGMAVLALFELVRSRGWLKGKVAALATAALVLTAPLIMGFQNWDDHSRRHHLASRDYAANFLNSVDENAIIFTYGDNDTYPLWYAQEVENIRRDVRVVNLSLIAVDWYINKLRNKVNESDPIKLTIPEAKYRGKLRNHILIYPQNETKPVDAIQALNAMASDQRPPGSNKDVVGYIPSNNILINAGSAFAKSGVSRTPGDSTVVGDYIALSLQSQGGYLTKDEIAVLDVIASNINTRPIYFAVTCKNEKLMGLNDFTQVEGLALRLVPVKTKSDPNIGIYGSGRVAHNKVYEHATKDWAWGNFDKYEMFVDNSYAAEVQAMKMVMLRASSELADLGENEKAIELADQYFEAFPAMNFRYDDTVYPLIDTYLKAGAIDKAKHHMKILAEESGQWLRWFDGMDEEVRDVGFQREYIMGLRSANNILRDVTRIQDDAFTEEMNQLLGAYSISNLRN